MWEWLQSLSGGAASFVGSLTGSAIGLVALLIGALFNAHLNRRRDDVLRKADGRAAAAALQAELSGVRRTLMRNANTLDTPEGDFVAPDLAHSIRVLPSIIPKIGLLDSDTIREVIDIYIIIDQYCEQLILLGGRIVENMPDHRRLVRMPQIRSENVATMNRNMAVLMETAITRLNAYLT